VAIADSLPGTGFAPIAVVSNSGCNNISVIDIAPQLPTYDASHILPASSPIPIFGTLSGAPLPPALIPSVSPVSIVTDWPSLPTIPTARFRP